MSKLNKRNLEIEEEKKTSTESRADDFKKGKGGKKRKFRPWKGKVRNDPSWHMKNNQMVKDVASIPFNHMAGFPIDMGTMHSPAYPKITMAYVRSFVVDWFAGISADFRSVLNQASTNLWSFIRGRNSGATNYQASDILINTVLAATDFYCNVAFVERLFKFHKHYLSTNRLLPRMIFNACGIDYEDFINNIAKYRYYFNTLVAKASSLVIPNEFPFIQQAIGHFTDIYKDRDSSTGREQLYIKVKQFHHIYDPVYNSQGGGVRLMVWSDFDKSQSTYSLYPVITGLVRNTNGSSAQNYATKLSMLLTIMEKQLNAIITDEDTNIMFGDLIKAFGDNGNFIHMQELTDESNGEFIYSEEILEQIHNSTPLPSVINNNTYFSSSYTTTDVFGDTVQVPVLNAVPTGASSATPCYTNNISQDAQGYILSNVSVMYSGSMLPYLQNNRWATKALLDTNDNNPSPEKIMNMTRMTNRYHARIITGTYARTEFAPISQGSVILFDGVLYAGDVANNMIYTYDVNSSIYTSPASGGLSDITWNDAMFMCANSHFDWAPIIYVTFNDPVNPTMIPLSDVNNVTSIDPTDIERIHQVSFLSLFDIPKTR